MSNNITLKEAENHEIVDAIELHNKYAVRRKEKEQWKHEYLGHKKDNYVFALAKYDDRVIGTYGMAPIELIVDKKKILSASGRNAVVDFEFRNSMIFKKLCDFTIEKLEKKGISLAWGLTDYGLIWRKLLRFTTLDNIIFRSIFVINAKKAFNYYKNNYSDSLQRNESFIEKLRLNIIELLFTLLMYYVRILHKFRKLNLKKNLKKFYVRNTPLSYSEVNGLNQHVNDKFGTTIFLDLNEKFLKWRIITNPVLNYETIYVYKNNILQGYCFFTMNERFGFCVISEFIFEKRIVADILLNKILDYAKSKNASFCYYMGNKHNKLNKKVKSFLNSSGSFSVVNRKSSFVFRVLSEKNYQKEKFEPKCWYINALWLEGYEG